MPLLAGDIGGTKTELSLFERGSAGLTALCSERYPSADFGSLTELVERFILQAGSDKHAIGGACFGIAGPIIGQRCKTTNLPWQVDAGRLADTLGCPVRLLNDFEAVALGVQHLTGDQLHWLQSRPMTEAGPVAIIGAGTGLGQAVVVPTTDGPRVLRSEGGHADLAPRTDDEVALLRFLQARHGRVSVERAVSGPGLASIYEFLVDTGRYAPCPRAGQADARTIEADHIGACALEFPAGPCGHALSRFVDLYGAEAGNLALKVLPTGGLFIAGGIAPKILAALTGGGFLEALLDKGRMRGLLEALPIAVVLEARVGLLGARRQAERIPLGG